MIYVNDVNPLKTYYLIEVTDEVIVIYFCDVQSQKANSLIGVTFEEIMICVNDEHPLKTEFPIEVTDVGIVI
ncbi:hypothetical protein M9Y10_036518 [Tritrichomonas musculus]|uniref:Uncharacterized protein n=1 Tax=Tritrichomonas musculus TaxID=1915356 RepID=A0ABR2GUB5_9EUKA